MIEIKEQTSADARLLSDAITALNISRHKAGMYPQGHPAIETSLQRAFDALQKLFEGKGNITLAAAKDLLFADDYPLDKNNPACREFALCLSNRSIALVILAEGLTAQELYAFHRFLAADPGEASPAEMEEKFKNCGLTHIKAEFIDYEVFSFTEGKSEEDKPRQGLWTLYVQELFKGTVRPESRRVIRSIPPEDLSSLINETDNAQLTDDACDRVMASYLSPSLEKASLVTDLNKLIKFINRLRPELKEQLLSSSLRALPRDINPCDEIPEAFDVDEAIALLDSINEKQIVIPEAIKNLIEKFSTLSTDGLEGRISNSKFIIDDIPLPYEITPMSAEDEFRKFVTDTYTRELEALRAFDAGDSKASSAEQQDHDWDEETFERDFNQILLELISFGREDFINQQDYEYFKSLLKEQVEHFIGTGQYAQVIKILCIARPEEGNTCAELTDLNVVMPETAGALVDSFRIVGVQHRDDALRLCRLFGSRIVPPLMEAIISEGSRKTRKFLLDLAVHIADEAVTEAIRHLSDTRWYVKRNMLLILSESGSREAISHVKPYCYNDNLRVCFYAVKYLLRAEMSCGLEALRHHIRSQAEDKVEMALRLATTLGITEIVPELIAQLTSMDKSVADLDKKIAIVRALGQLGDPRALNTLKSILHTRSLFFRDPLKRLKREVARTLKNYPPQDVSMMISSFLERS